MTLFGKDKENNVHLQAMKRLELDSARRLCHPEAHCKQSACVLAGAIMVTERASSPFSSLAPTRSFADGTILFKLFSTDRLSKATLEAIFEEHTTVGVFPWLAYPVFQPPEQFAPFKLADKLFYNNAWENGASCMEMSAISAMNSALLVQKALNSSLPPLVSLGKSSNTAEL